MHTFHLLFFMLFRTSALVAGLPLYTTLLIDGAHLSNYAIQLEIVDKGTTIKKGP